MKDGREGGRKEGRKEKRKGRRKQRKKQIPYGSLGSVYMTYLEELNYRYRK
jgi:hypothetical protein